MNEAVNIITVLKNSECECALVDVPSAHNDDYYGVPYQRKAMPATNNRRAGYEMKPIHTNVFDVL